MQPPSRTTMLIQKRIVNAKGVHKIIVWRLAIGN